MRIPASARGLTATTASLALAVGVTAALAGPAAAASSTLYAYATGTTNVSGCPGVPVATSGCSLTQALSQAAAGDTIDLATAGGVAHYVGNWTVAVNNTSATAPLTITAASGLAQAPVLDGNSGKASGCTTGECSGPILFVGQVSLNISNVSFVNGHASYGGAIDNGDSQPGGTVTVANSTFTANHADYGGGAIANAQSSGGSGVLTVSNSTFTNNTTNGVDDGGGAIANAEWGGQGSLTVHSSTFTGNSTSTSGGAIANGGVYGNDDGQGSLVVDGSTFTDNSSVEGGAIANAWLSQRSTNTVQITTSTFTGNAATSGGALSNGYRSDNGTATISGSTFSGNSATSVGGAVSNGRSGIGTTSLSITRATFSGNSANAGGALANAPDGTASATVTGSLFSGNSATTRGGGIDEGGSDGDGVLTVGRSTFTGNSADVGGALAVSGGSATAVGSTLAKDTSGTAAVSPEIYQSPATSVVVAGDLFAGRCFQGGVNWKDDGYNAASQSSCTKSGTGDVVQASVATALGQLNTTNVTDVPYVLPPDTSNPALGIVPNGAVVADAPGQTLCPRTDAASVPTPTGSSCSAGAVDLQAPAGVAATAGNGAVTVSWSPASAKARTVQAFDVSVAAQSGAEDFLHDAACHTTGTTCTIPGLTNGTTYYFVVNSRTSGRYAESTEVSATPTGPPGAPTNVTVTGGVGKATVSWQAPTATGGSPITGYRVYVASAHGQEYLDANDSCETNATTLQCVITRDQNGAALKQATTYWFGVEAVNAVQASGLSDPDASATTDDVPGPPTGIAATAGNRSVSVTWAAPTATGGSPVTGYRVFVASASGNEKLDSTDSCETNAATLRCVVTKDQNGAALKNGTQYWFSVEAVNAVGASALATPDAGATTVDVPSVPEEVRASSGDGRVTVSWQPPAGDGGSPIVDYRVFATVRPSAGDPPQRLACTTAPSVHTCTVTGLRNGTEYWFQVDAVNAAGPGPVAEVSALPAPTPTLATKYAVVAKGARAVLSGRGVPGASVALYAGRHRLATAYASSKGVFSFTRTLTATTSFTVVSDGKTSKAVKVSVVTLTLGVVGKQPLRAGRQVFTGHAPRGMTVVLQQDGKTVAHLTATSKNAFSFRFTLTRTHKFRVVCDGVTTRAITVRVR